MSTPYYDDTPEGGAEPELPVVWSEGQWKTMSPGDTAAARTSTEHRKARADFRKACEERNEPCWLDNRPIDYSLKWPHPDSWSLDHAITVKDRPDLLNDPTNFRASHFDCNVRRGTDEPRCDLGEPSEVW